MSQAAQPSPPNDPAGPRQSGLRRFLDGLYLASGILAGLFLAAIGATIVAQIAGRLIGWTIDSTELAGFCMAASTFLGLAYTLKSGTHVRVNLLIRRLPAPLKRPAEIGCCLVGIVASAYFTWFALQLVLQSWRFGDTSPGLLAAPFWIPQAGMAIGGALLVIAFLDEMTIVWRGGQAGYESEEAVLDQFEPDGRAPAIEVPS